MSKREAKVLFALAMGLIVGLLLRYGLPTDTPIEDSYPEVRLPTKEEYKDTRNDEIREALVEQGYPEEVVDSLLTQGAQRATELRNIASVYEEYGFPWNIPLYVGGYELVSLHLVGNTDEQKFVLGQYEDETGENTVFMHMSLVAPVSTLRAGLSYSYEQQLDYATAYTDQTGKIVGFYFEVEIEDEDRSILRYVATTSSRFTHDDIDSFIGSVVDGRVMKNN